jgi:hypothetical protein
MMVNQIRITNTVTRQQKKKRGKLDFFIGLILNSSIKRKEGKINPYYSLTANGIEEVKHYKNNHGFKQS